MKHTPHDYYEKAETLLMGDHCLSPGMIRHAKALILLGDSCFAYLCESCHQRTSVHSGLCSECCGSAYARSVIEELPEAERLKLWIMMREWYPDETTMREERWKRLAKQAQDELRNSDGR